MSYTTQQRASLIDVAREAIDYGLHHPSAPQVIATSYETALQEIRASFVTLYLRRELRGCIGSLEASRPLVVDVAQNAHAAAFLDPRFLPLQAQEFPELDIHISALSPKSVLEFVSEEDLLCQLRPGVDGLVIAMDRCRGTFLPSVWSTLTEPRAFLKHLKIKAGIPESIYQYKAWRYTVEEI